MAHKTETPKVPSVADSVLELERLIQKVIRKAFNDSTLDYTVQIAATSIEPGKVKYGFMINGLKKEIQPIAMSYYSFDECKAVIQGLLTEVDPLKVEKMFHQGRINVYKNAITSHEDRMKQLDEHGLEEPDGIEMEEV